MDHFVLYALHYFLVVRNTINIYLGNRTLLIAIFPKNLSTIMLYF